MGRPLRTIRGCGGITLIELMIAIAIIATVAAIALPAYRDYVETAAVGVLAAEIATMEPFQQDTRLRTGSYGIGTWDFATDDTSLTDATGWAPRNPDGATYVVLADEAGYRVTATDPAGRSVCRIMPARRPC
ncbi:MAG: prepilin-type N-terminal cleavage/methylation domain-containing protein [Gammaproteobacteria bacterium]|nr:prepilin-type N-terminal cleavage/methylation domain-containing protein [Gammaproteobacteria bacterium]MYE82216.1 prepilin-type N-terminal cleavage/methylation domain-containing protein [Gammaproteobacteria bacterium]